METTICLSRVLGPQLRGKIDGRRHFGVLCSALSDVRPGSVTLLDFDGVEDVSASWIAAALLPLPAWVCLPEHDLYPVLTGIGREGKKWADEFELVAGNSGVIFLIWNKLPNSQVRIVGALDDALLRTLQAVRRYGEATGAGLKRLYPEESIGATGWSNRLKDLHTKRLLRRVTRGREQIYTVALEVDLDGAAGTRVSDLELSPENAERGTSLPVAHSV